MTLLAITIVLLLVVSVADARRPRGDQSWQWRVDVWMPGHWQRLAECESGSNPPDWTHHSYYEGVAARIAAIDTRALSAARGPSSAHTARLSSLRSTIPGRPHDH